MLSLLAAATQDIASGAIASGAVSDPIQWAELGLKPGIDFGVELFGIPIILRYYSLAYLGGILFAYWHLSRMIKAPGSPLAQRHVDDLFFYCTLGVILGGRLGYATFYQPKLWTSLDLFKLWDGGMSFHGGLIGVLVAILFIAKTNKLSFLRVCDYVAVGVPMGMFLGRLANFINGELWGRTTDVPWAMVFPGGGPLARHPSQLYEAVLEGLLLLILLLVLFWKTRARFRPGLLVGVFTAGIALGRFTVEFFRQPDEQLTQFAIDTGLSMGQWLTIPLIVLGVALVIISLRRPPLASGAVAVKDRPVTA